MNKTKNQTQFTQKQLEEMKIMIQVGKFSFNILHDLINPITGLAIYLENIKDEDLKNDLKPIFEANGEIRNFLKTFQDTVDRPDKTEYVDVEKVIKSSMILIRHKALKNNVSISFSRSVSGLHIKMRKLNFYQIMLNLIGNSIDSLKEKNGNEKRLVSISLSENQNSFRLTIADNGSGMKKSIQEKIFDKNFTTKTRGFGIGLNTVRDIVEKNLKGTIKVSSEINRGTRFHIYFPKEISRKIKDR
jgi:signal transduction histidine kinase